MRKARWWIIPPGLFPSRPTKTRAMRSWRWWRAAVREAAPARRSSRRFIRPFSNGNSQLRESLKLWPRTIEWQLDTIDMFDADLQHQKSRIDRLQIAALCGLMVIGALFVYSATMVSGSAGLAAWYNQLWFRQIIWYGIGTGAAAALCLVDYHTVARWSMIAYWISVLLLALVLVCGTVRFGARRWFDLGFFSLQPSEFAKLAFILAQAHFLSRPVEELRVLQTFWKALGLMLLPFVLFLGNVIVLTLYGVVLFIGIRIAGQARDRLGKLMAVGVVTLLFSHVFINIGMNIRLMPVTGVPLPLLSYGGSSVLGSLIAMGMLQNVYMYRKNY